MTCACSCPLLPLLMIAERKEDAGCNIQHRKHNRQNPCLFQIFGTEKARNFRQIVFPEGTLHIRSSNHINHIQRFAGELERNRTELIARLDRCVDLLRPVGNLLHTRQISRVTPDAGITACRLDNDIILRLGIVDRNLTELCIR